MSRVLVGLSGGVDSSVAAAVLRDEGHEVVGVTMKLWGGASDTGCCSVADVDDARRAADRLGLDHHVFNFGGEFDERVVEPYVRAHALGSTPNPCVECNRHLKFDVLLRRAAALGFDAVATGHHARLVSAPDGLLRVARGADPAKDQSYVLAVLTPAAMERVRFPIGTMTKAEVRARAAALALPTAAKPDSQDVCFIRRREGRAGFLGDRLRFTPAPVVDTAGRRLGHVEAIELVTVGQRRGVGVAGGHGPRYVVEVDHRGPTVVVGAAEELLVPTTPIDRWTWAAAAVEGPVAVQTSAHGEAQPALVDTGAGVIRWEAPRRRVAPGQLVVAYAGDCVVGSATAR
jgi:tRNA-specific 2-thiouridylase